MVLGPSSNLHELGMAGILMGSGYNEGLGLGVKCGDDGFWMI